MCSVTFDKLWAVAYEREGELLRDAARLGKAYAISSALEAIAMARDLHEAGRPFFAYCEEIYKDKQQIRLDRMKRQYRMTPAEVKFAKMMMDKAAKGAW
jgi:hypothetical protein